MTGALQRWLVFVPVAPLLLLIASCGTGWGTDPASSDRSASRSSSSGAAGSPRVSGSAAAIGVLVTTDAARYGLSSVIEVTVVNGESVAVFTEDQKSDCTLVTLQAKTDSGWVRFSTCGSERMARTVELAPGERRRMRIQLNSENFRPQPVVPGVYRVVFTFRRAPLPLGSEPEMAASRTFEVQ